jgi:hypothetical protein
MPFSTEFNPFYQKYSLSCSKIQDSPYSTWGPFGINIREKFKEDHHEVKKALG